MVTARTADPPGEVGLSMSEADAAWDARLRAEYEEAAREALQGINADVLLREGIPADEHPLLVANLGDPAAPVSFIAEDIFPVGQVVALCGEEGGGKSFMAWQIAGELTRGVPVMNEFAVPAPVRSVLIIDVEQTPEDVRISFTIRPGCRGPRKNLCTDGKRHSGRG